MICEDPLSLPQNRYVDSPAVGIIHLITAYKVLLRYMILDTSSWFILSSQVRALVGRALVNIPS